jgi:hypothetical protein
VLLDVVVGLADRTGLVVVVVWWKETALVRGEARPPFGEDRDGEAVRGEVVRESEAVLVGRSIGKLSESPLLCRAVRRGLGGATGLLGDGGRSGCCDGALC